MGAVRKGFVALLVVAAVYLVWTGTGCVSEDEMRVESFRTQHQIIQDSTIPDDTRRIDAHVVYRNRAKDDFNYTALPEEARRLVNGSDLEGDLIPFFGSDYEQYTVLVTEVRLYNRNSDVAVDCVYMREGRYDSMTVHSNLTVSDEREEDPGLSYERTIIRIPGPVPDRSRFRFRVVRGGEVVTTWEEDPTLHG